MNSLEPPDTYHLSAAEGWLGLNNSSEALGELDKISPGSQEHPEVLYLRWHALARLKRWTACVEVGRRLIESAPEQISSWQNFANSLFYEKRYLEAFNALFPAIQKFPEEWSIPYNLACYQCQLGKPAEALYWLKMALGLGDPHQVKKYALSDPDLSPVAPQIREL